MTKLYKTKIIGFAGKKASGKDTAYDSILKSSKPVLASSVKCARLIKQIGLVAHPNWKEDTHYEGEFKEVVDELYGYSPRQFLQNLGQSLREVASGISTRCMGIDIKALIGICEEPATAMLRYMVNKESQDKENPDLYPFTAEANFICVTDVRHQDEVDAIKALGGDVYIIDRDGVDTSDKHPSETQELEGCLHIYNNGTKEDLAKEVDKLIISPFLSTRTMQAKYLDAIRILHNLYPTLEDSDKEYITYETSTDFSQDVNDIIADESLDLKTILSVSREFDTYKPTTYSLRVKSGITMRTDTFYSKNQADDFASGYKACIADFKLRNSNVTVTEV